MDYGNRLPHRKLVIGQKTHNVLRIIYMFEPNISGNCKEPEYIADVLLVIKMTTIVKLCKRREQPRLSQSKIHPENAKIKFLEDRKK